MTTLPAISSTPRPGSALSRIRSEKMRDFIVLRARGFSLAKSVQLAGYECASPLVAKHLGYNMTQQDNVREAIVECVEAEIAAGAPDSLKRLRRIAKDTTILPAVRAKVDIALIDRAGLAPTQKIDVAHSHEIKPPTTLEELFRRNGLEMPDSLKAMSSRDVVDAEFEEVKPEPEPSTAGLEDLFA